jgi:hypothetical protein
VKGDGITATRRLPGTSGFAQRKLDASFTETSVSLSPLVAIRRGGELLDGVILVVSRAAISTLCRHSTRDSSPIAISERTFIVIEEEQPKPPAISWDLVKLAALNKPDEFVPLGMRQPNGVALLTDCHALVGNLDLRAFVAVLA